MVVDVLAGVFLAISIGVPIYLYATRPRKRRRRSLKHRQRRWAAGIYVLFVLIAVFSMTGIMAL